MKAREGVLKQIDLDYAYGLAKAMESFRSNPVLGYRTAGSRAEFETGEMLRAEMARIGLKQVRKEPVAVDGWEFKEAVLAYTPPGGRRREIQLGAYQTTCVTRGFETFELLYLGRGAARDYEGVDAAGKLVLVEINQRDEWWINYPVYQAHLKGARGVIAVQRGGYGEIADEALNAQDIAGPEDAPAFSISRRDAQPLIALMAGGRALPVALRADSRVTRNTVTYNITGVIPGRHPERKVLLSAHYDSYFSGFQDDNTAVAMMLGIAKALLDSGYQPRNTLVFCAMAAEEWGVADSYFDWSTGAYEQVFTLHPEWAGQVIADLNFELPALAHGTRARIRSCYEYTRFLKEFLGELPALTQAYPEETQVTAPIETWSDDFSMAIGGIPSMVNDFTGGSFMATHYHSQFDSDAYYDPQVYRLHHELFALLVLALDETAVVPLCFSPVMARGAEGIDPSLAAGETGTRLVALKALFTRRREEADAAYEKAATLNRRYARLLAAGEEEAAEAVYQAARPLEARLLKSFKALQDALVRIDWYGNVAYPLELAGQNLRLMRGAAEDLAAGDIAAALGKLYRVDNNAYAFMFDEAVYTHFSDYVLNQPKERLKWGGGRLMPHANLYRLVKALLAKEAAGDADFEGETLALRAACRAQEQLLAQTAAQLAEALPPIAFD